MTLYDNPSMIEFLHSQKAFHKRTRVGKKACAPKGDGVRYLEYVDVYSDENFLKPFDGFEVNYLNERAVIKSIATLAFQDQDIVLRGNLSLILKPFSLILENYRDDIFLNIWEVNDESEVLKRCDLTCDFILIHKSEEVIGSLVIYLSDYPRIIIGDGVDALTFQEFRLILVNSKVQLSS